MPWFCARPRFDLIEHYRRILTQFCKLTTLWLPWFCARHRFDLIEHYQRILTQFCKLTDLWLPWFCARPRFDLIEHYRRIWTQFCELTTPSGRVLPTLQKNKASSPDPRRWRHCRLRRFTWLHGQHSKLPICIIYLAFGRALVHWQWTNAHGWTLNPWSSAPCSAVGIDPWAGHALVHRQAFVHWSISSMVNSLSNVLCIFPSLFQALRALFPKSFASLPHGFRH